MWCWRVLSSYTDVVLVADAGPKSDQGARQVGQTAAVTVVLSHLATQNAGDESATQTCREEEQTGTC